ncbi:MAG: MAPEG family protein [Pseudomonadota bacterium]
MPLPITALYAGLLALWLFGLSIAVIRLRWRHRVSLGDGGVDVLERIGRAHGNAAETVPICLILLALSEGLGASALVLHLFGLMLLVGRLTHGVHFLTNRRTLGLRQIGMTLTFFVMLGLGISLVVQGIGNLAGNA